MKEAESKKSTIDIQTMIYCVILDHSHDVCDNDPRKRKKGVHFGKRIHIAITHSDHTNNTIQKT